MKKHFLSLACLGLALTSLHAQTKFQKYINKNSFIKSDVYAVPGGLLHRGLSGNNTFEGFCMISDSGTLSWSHFYSPPSLFAGGVFEPVNDTLYYHVTVPDTNTISLYKSGGASILWKYNYDLTTVVDNANNEASVVKVKVLSNGNICVLGFEKIPASFEFILAPYIILFNPNGQLLWSKEYQATTNSFNPFDVTLSSTGNLIVVGTTHSLSNGNYQTSEGFATMAVDAGSGNLSGSGGINACLNGLDGEITFSNFDEVNHLITLSILNLFNSDPHSSSTLIIKINESTGVFVSASRLDADPVTDVLNISATKTYKNSTYMCGAYEDGSAGYPLLSYPFCMKTDTLVSKIQWASHYGMADKEGRIDVIKPTAGTLLLGGVYDDRTSYLWRIDESTGTGPCNSTQTKIKISPFHFTDTIYNTAILYANYITPGYAVVPQKDVEEVVPTPGVVQVCSTLSGIDDEINPNDITLFPNPSNGHINIKIEASNLIRNTKFILINSLAQVIKQVSVNEELTAINLDGVGAGIYFYKIEGGDVVLKSGKIIIE